MTGTLTKEDLARASSLLTDFRDQLQEGEERSLRNSMDKLIQSFSSPFFNALIDINYYYKTLLSSQNLSIPQYKAQPVPLRQVNLPGSTLLPTESLHIIQDPLAPHIGGYKVTDFYYFEVALERPANTTGGFGFSIAGGYDAPDESGDPSIFITKIATDGIAERHGQLAMRDQIMSVNGTSLEHVANLEAVQILRQAGDRLILSVRRHAMAPSSIVDGGGSGFHPPASQLTNSDQPTYVNDRTRTISNNGRVPSPVDDGMIWEEVRLVKPNSGVSLGFTISSGSTQPSAPTGIFITKINPGGVADLSGQLQLGDQVVTVNGVDLTHASHEQAVNTLRNAGLIVNLVICRSSFAGSEFSGSVTQPANNNGYYR